MRKFVRTGLCLAAAAVLATGCGSKNAEETTAAAESTEAAAETKSEEELTDEASIAVGEYKGLTLTTKKSEVTDEDVQNYLEYLKSLYPTEVTDRAAADGDTVNIDFEGTKDGVAFDGGTAQGYDLTLGSGMFIDGFEDGVIGMMPGEERDLDLTFPEDYGNEELNGQAVVFHVTLNSIKDVENTAIDDALARRALSDAAATLDTLTAQVRDELERQAELSYFNDAGTELLEQAVANSEITCDPDAVDEMLSQLRETYTSYASQSGLDLTTFLSLYGSTEDDLQTMAEGLVKQEMVLDEIIAKENLTATDEQKDAIAQMNRFDDAASMESAYGDGSADHLFEMGAAYYYLIDNAVVSDAAETEAAETTAAQ